MVLRGGIKLGNSLQRSHIFALFEISNSFLNGWHTFFQLNTVAIWLEVLILSDAFAEWVKVGNNRFGSGAGQVDKFENLVSYLVIVSFLWLKLIFLIFLRDCPLFLFETFF